jgi:hypothetical protein
MFSIIKIDPCETKYTGKISTVVYIGAGEEVNKYHIARLDYDLKEDFLDEMIIFIRKEYLGDKICLEIHQFLSHFKGTHPEKDYRVLTNGDLKNVSKNVLDDLKRLTVAVAEYTE